MLMYCLSSPICMTFGGISNPGGNKDRAGEPALGLEFGLGAALRLGLTLGPGPVAVVLGAMVLAACCREGVGLGTFAGICGLAWCDGLGEEAADENAGDDPPWACMNWPAGVGVLAPSEVEAPALLVAVFGLPVVLAPAPPPPPPPEAFWDTILLISFRTIRDSLS